ncbi:MAG: mechanosensitive ion channel domain-containing protein [Cyanobacteria bacterium J06623_5]
MRKCSFGTLFVSVSLSAILLLPPAFSPPAIAQDTPPETANEETAASEAAPAPTQSTTPDNGTYFADVMVRGQAIFQVGSLNDLSADARAAIISRRIASLLERNTERNAERNTERNAERNTERNTENDTALTVTAAPVPNAKLINLEANSRVLMTVTEQDAQDLGLPLETLADTWATQLTQSFDRPPVAIDVVQRLNTTLRQLGRDAIASIPALIGVLVVTLITWLIAKGVRFSAFSWAQRTEGDRSTEILIGRLGYGAVWIAGAVVALGVWGIDFATMLGALGLTSVAIGFSLKDVLSNYISGVILLAARPFHIGDQVVINGYEGTITQVQLRSTTLRTYDGRMVYIPNQEVFQASITNNTAAKYLRSSVTVGIDYAADLVRARQVIVNAIATLDEVQPEPMPEVLVRELAASTVNLEVRFWVDSRRAGFLETSSIVTQRVKEALQEQDIEMPTEIYTLLLKDVPEDLKASSKNNKTNGLNQNIPVSQTGTIAEA